MKIRGIFQEDIERPIEEVIKVDQVNEAVVYEELREYVPTDALQHHFREVLEATNASRTEPMEGIGVWISGFFGSGKSSFAKMLGYILARSFSQGAALTLRSFGRLRLRSVALDLNPDRRSEPDRAFV